MIFTYTAIFLASLLVAVLARFIYKSVLASKRSAQRAKERLTGLNRTADFQKAKVGSISTGGTLTPAGWRNYGEPRDVVRAHPAMPAGNRNRKGVWPYREEKSGSTGSTYRVKRSRMPKTQNLESLDKPWGW